MNKPHSDLCIDYDVQWIIRRKNAWMQMFGEQRSENLYRAVTKQLIPVQKIVIILEKNVHWSS